MVPYLNPDNQAPGFQTGQGPGGGGVGGEGVILL